MLIKTKCTVDLVINSATDLPKLKEFMDNNKIKINLAEIARQMHMDYRTVKKYLNGYVKPKTRDRPNPIDGFKRNIEELLSSKTQIFYYRRDLYHYLKDNNGLKVSENSFYHYIRRHPEYNSYFVKGNKRCASNAVLRYETAPGDQAQIDWKERIPFVLRDTGEVIYLNILVMILGHSRFRIFKPSLWTTQETLIHLLNECFEVIGGVPHSIVTDNMKTVMDKARTPHHKGKVNAAFQQFAKDYGFKILPCKAATPQTKGKVESQMKILDEVQAYSGKLDLVELFELVEKINNRTNNTVNQGSGRIPVFDLQTEKDSLLPLPAENVRNQYRIKTMSVKVNTASMISVKSNQYSVPKIFIGKSVAYQIHDSNVYIYDNTKLIAMHALSDKKLNYLPDHYLDIMAAAFPYKDKDDIKEIARKNLNLIGGIYSDE